ncbi:hypothetical protein ABZS76_28595 [Streptomyces sp. NPDC005562]|uniref:hypothetical protein n=1 Tax=Streptomyces sp. NPDC005562 TaxID=3154890 RepID=UPI0033B2710F
MHPVRRPVFVHPAFENLAASSVPSGRAATHRTDLLAVGAALCVRRTPHTTWAGEPHDAEPDRQDGLFWVPIERPPADCHPHTPTTSACSRTARRIAL